MGDAATPLTLVDALASTDAALALAGPTGVVPPPARRSTRYVQFTIADTHYAVPQAFVTELDRVPRVTIVPQTPPWLRGVTNVRGDVLSVVDLRRFLGLDATSDQTGRLIVVRLVDEEFALGLLVDGVHQIVSLEADAIRPPASPLEGPLAPFLAGISVAGGCLVAVLDLERLLRSAEMRQFDETKEDSSCEAR